MLLKNAPCEVTLIHHGVPLIFVYQFAGQLRSVISFTIDGKFSFITFFKQVTLSTYQADSLFIYPSMCVGIHYIVMFTTKGNVSGSESCSCYLT